MYVSDCILGKIARGVGPQTGSFRRLDPGDRKPLSDSGVLNPSFSTRLHPNSHPIKEVSRHNERASPTTQLRDRTV